MSYAQLMLYQEDTSTTMKTSECMRKYFKIISRSETEAEMENEDGMSSLPRILIMFSYPKGMDSVALTAQREHGWARC